MAYLIASRQNYLGYEQHYSDGSVICYDPAGALRSCDPASVQAQQVFYQQVTPPEAIPVEYAPMYSPSGPAMSMAPEVALENVFQGTYSPSGPAASPVGMEMEMALPPTMLFSQSPGNIMTGAYSIPAPQPYTMPTLDVAYGRAVPTQGYNVSNIAGQNSLEGGRAVAGALGAAGCALITNAAARAACEAALLAVGLGKMMNSMGASNGSGNVQLGGGGCMPGLVMNSAGNCVSPMSPVGAQTLQGAQYGVFGALSVPAVMVSTMKLRCPPGLILGKDSRCYAKGALPRQYRKWKPEPRPLVSRSDVKALARIKSIRARVKKAASSAGLHTSTRSSSTAVVRRKK